MKSTTSAPIVVIEAGQEDPRWLTILGGQRLAAADVLVYSPAVNLGVLVYAAANAELLAYAAENATLVPDDVDRHMRESAASGRRVVWLVPPGRGRDAAARLAAEGRLPQCEVIPGVSDEALQTTFLRVSPHPCPLPRGEGDVSTRPSALPRGERDVRGARVLVTRPRHQAGPLWERLVELGAEVVLQPAIRVLPPENWDLVDAALARLADFNWLVFSSSNGVCSLLDRLLDLGRDMRNLAGVRLAAIGPGTAEQLAQYRLRADLVPQEFRAETLAEALKSAGPRARFLLARASRGREVLAEQLQAAGAQVEQVVVYRSLDVEVPDPLVRSLVSHGEIDWITVTSSAIARSLVRLFGDDLRRSRLASLSPVTSSTLRELGHEPAAEATVYTMEGLAAAIAGIEDRGHGTENRQ